MDDTFHTLDDILNGIGDLEEGSKKSKATRHSFPLSSVEDEENQKLLESLATLRQSSSPEGLAGKDLAPTRESGRPSTVHKSLLGQNKRKSTDSAPHNVTRPCSSSLDIALPAISVRHNDVLYDNQKAEIGGPNRGGTAARYQRLERSLCSILGRKGEACDVSALNSESLPWEKLPTALTNLRKRKTGSLLEKDNEQKKRAKVRERMTKVGAVPFELPKSAEELQQIFKKRDMRLDETAKRRKTKIEEQQTSLEQAIGAKYSIHQTRIAMKEMRLRQEKLMSIITLSTRLPDWFQYISVEADRRRRNFIENEAARKIQEKYKSLLLLRMIANARRIQRKLVKLRWKMILWVRSTKKRVHSQRIRQFFVDFSTLQMEYVVYIFRKRVIRAQQLMRHFVECKNARWLALEKMWAILEPDVAKNVRQKKYYKAPTPVAVQPQRRKTARAIAGQVILAMAVKKQLHDLDLPIVFDRKIDVRRMLCKFHLEDQRREHSEQASKKRAEIARNPQISKKDAQMLLAGSEPDFEQLNKKTWPLFKLFGSKARGRLKQTIHSFLRDEDSVREAVQKRLNKESQEITANSYLCERDNRRWNDKNGGGNERTQLAESEELALLYATTSKDIQALRETFNLVDHDGGGTIDSRELARLLDILGMHKEGDEVQELIDRLTSGMKEISFKEYIKALRGVRPNPSYSEEHIRDAFSTFAKGMPKGQIRKVDVIRALTSFEGKWDMNRAIDTVRDAGLVKSVIDYREYVRVMFHLCRR